MSFSVDQQMTEIYYCVDEFLKLHPALVRWRRSRRRVLYRWALTYVQRAASRAAAQRLLRSATLPHRKRERGTPSVEALSTCRAGCAGRVPLQSIGGSELELRTAA
jgi:hypothetical protein